MQFLSTPAYHKVYLWVIKLSKTRDCPPIQNKIPFLLLAREHWEQPGLQVDCHVLPPSHLLTATKRHRTQPLIIFTFCHFPGLPQITSVLRLQERSFHLASCLHISFHFIFSSVLTMHRFYFRDLCVLFTPAVILYTKILLLSKC